MCKKITAVAMMAAFAAMVASTNAAPVGRDFSGFDEDTTAVVYGTAGTVGAAYYYGFEVNPTLTSVNLDGMSGGGVGDFHTSNAPLFDTVNGLAYSKSGGIGESVLRTDFGGSLWRAQFADLTNYVIEAKVNLLGTGGEGPNGVFGFTGGNTVGGHNVHIGLNFLWVNGTIIDSTTDNTGWHTWRLEFASDGYNVFRDGLQVGGVQALQVKGDKNLVGDYSGTGFLGDWQVEYLAMDTVIPEPATLGLVAAFGGAVLFLRRKLMI